MAHNKGKGLAPGWMNPKSAAEVARQKAAGQENMSGGDQKQRENEARTLLKMIGSVDWDNEGVALTAGSHSFLEDMFQKANSIPTGLFVSAKQLFWLRDIKDRLIAAGLL